MMNAKRVVSVVLVLILVFAIVGAVSAGSANWPDPLPSGPPVVDGTVVLNSTGQPTDEYPLHSVSPENPRGCFLVVYRGVMASPPVEGCLWVAFDRVGHVGYGLFLAETYIPDVYMFPTVDDEEIWLKLDGTKVGFNEAEPVVVDGQVKGLEFSFLTAGLDPWGCEVFHAITFSGDEEQTAATGPCGPTVITLRVQAADKGLPPSYFWLAIPAGIMVIGLTIYLAYSVWKNRKK